MVEYILFDLWWNCVHLFKNAFLHGCSLWLPVLITTLTLWIWDIHYQIYDLFASVLCFRMTLTVSPLSYLLRFLTLFDLLFFVLIVAKVYWSWCIMTTIFLVNILFQLRTCIRCFFICWGCSVLLLAQSSVWLQFPVNMCDTCFSALSFHCSDMFDICSLLILDDS